MNKTELVEHIAKNADISKAAATRALADKRLPISDIVFGLFGVFAALWVWIDQEGITRRLGALLEFDVRAVAERQTEFRLRSRFFPKGIGGILYWHALAFFHRRMLRGLTGGIAAAVGEPILAGPLPDTESWEDACNPGASR